MIAIVIYLVVMNIVAFALMGTDKSLAKQRGKQRISERRLMTYAALGGSVGAYLGMRIYRHKTKHVKFVVGLPAFVLIHIVLIAGLFRWLMAS